MNTNFKVYKYNVLYNVISFRSVYYDPFLAAAATADSNYRLQVNKRFVFLPIAMSVPLLINI